LLFRGEVDDDAAEKSNGGNHGHNNPQDAALWQRRRDQRVKVKSAQELVEKLRNEAKVI